jgi:hypothetical protein
MDASPRSIQDTIFERVAEGERRVVAGNNLAQNKAMHAVF